MLDLTNVYSSPLALLSDLLQRRVYIKLKELKIHVNFWNFEIMFAVSVMDMGMHNVKV